MIYSNLSLVVLGFLFWSQNNETVPILTETEALPPSSLLVQKADLELRPLEGLVYYQSAVFSGTALILDMHKQKRESIQYLRGKKHGTYRKWFPNGILSYEAQYEGGKLEGIARSWWKNGNLRSEARYEQGVVHGRQRQWYVSGTKFKERNIVRGREEGMQRSWRENGKLYNNYEARNGRIFGLKRSTLCYELDNGQIQGRN